MYSTLICTLFSVYLFVDGGGNRLNFVNEGFLIFPPTDKTDFYHQMHITEIWWKFVYLIILLIYSIMLYDLRALVS